MAAFKFRNEWVGDLYGKRQNTELNIRNENTRVKRIMEHTKEPKGSLMEDDHRMVVVVGGGEGGKFKQQGKLIWNGVVLCSKW